jgi:hypothetical protein
MKKPADKMSLKFLPGVCSLIRGNAHNRFMAFRTPEISPVQSVRNLRGPNSQTPIYPTTPHFPPMHLKTIMLRRKKPKRPAKTKNLSPGACRIRVPKVLSLIEHTAPARLSYQVRDSRERALCAYLPYNRIRIDDE